MDRLFPKLAELSALLSSGELAHSPAGWVTLSTLNAYTGRAVPGNFDPQSQTVVDSGEAPYCEAKNDERKWCQKEDRSHGLVSTADTARQGRRKKNNAAKLSRLF